MKQVIFTDVLLVVGVATDSPSAKKQRADAGRNKSPDYGAAA
jgi:hypothetical protein